MTAPGYVVEYRRPEGASWWASTEGLTAAAEWASRMSLEDAQSHVSKTLRHFHDAGLKARIALVRRGAGQ
jgi:ferritin